MTPTTPLPWLATFTRRWHANPDLCHTVDPIGWHSGRMAILALHLFGPDASRELLVACLKHDLGEYGTGDVAQPAKRDPILKAALDRIEGQTIADMGMAFTVSPEDARRLKYLDRLDAFLWALHYAPHILGRAGWVRDAAWLEAETAYFKPEMQVQP